MANGETNKEVYERLAKLETKVTEICKQLDTIKNNDLAHLEVKVDRNSDKIDAIERKLAYAAGALAVINIVVPFVIHYLFG